MLRHDIFCADKRRNEITMNNKHVYVTRGISLESITFGPTTRGIFNIVIYLDGSMKILL